MTRKSIHLRRGIGCSVVFIAIAACATPEKSDNETDPIRETVSSSHVATSGAGGGLPAGRSGDELCATADDCSAGLTCEHSTLGDSGVCVSDCSSDSDCGPSEACIDGSSAGFDPSCLMRCTTSADCAAGFGCYDIGEADVCLPFDWAGSDPTKGIGDACSSNGECISGTCVGWCTTTCSDYTDCAGQYGGLNEFGTDNWCILNGNNDYICFPGCSGNSAVCNNYSGASCQQGVSPYGNTLSICAG